MAMKMNVGADAPLDEARALTAAACLFHGFSDPSRLAILRHLALGEHRVVDLTAHLSLAQSTVSNHLACLKDCGLVTSRSKGRASVFSLNHADAVMGLFAAAEHLLELTGDAVTLCPNFGRKGHPRGGRQVYSRGMRRSTQEASSSAELHQRLMRRSRRGLVYGWSAQRSGAGSACGQASSGIQAWLGPPVSYTHLR